MRPAVSSRISLCRLSCSPPRSSSAAAASLCVACAHTLHGHGRARGAMARHAWHTRPASDDKAISRSRRRPRSGHARVTPLLRPGRGPRPAVSSPRYRSQCVPALVSATAAGLPPLSQCRSSVPTVTVVYIASDSRTWARYHAARPPSIDKPKRVWFVCPACVEPGRRAATSIDRWRSIPRELLQAYYTFAFINLCVSLPLSRTLFSPFLKHCQHYPLGM